MSERLTITGMGQVAARLFRMLDIVQKQDLSIASMKVLLEVFVRTTDLERPHAPTPSETASSLGMSVSAVSRLMAKLAEEGGPGLLQSDRSIPGSRAEAYVLTSKGKDFVASIFSALTDLPLDPIEAHTLGSYARARWEEGLTSAKLRQVEWDEGTLTLVVTPGEAAMSREVQEWTSENMSGPPSFVSKGKEVAVRFPSMTDAIYFKLRWC